MTLENTHSILMPHPSVFSSVLHSQFHIQFSHCLLTPFPLRPSTLWDHWTPQLVFVCVRVLLLIRVVSLSVWAHAAVITAV